MSVEKLTTMGEHTVTLLAAGQGGSSFLMPNGTFFVELFIFLIVLGVIRVFVVPPVMKALGDRDAMVRETVEETRIPPVCSPPRGPTTKQRWVRRATGLRVPRRPC